MNEVIISVSPFWAGYTTGTMVTLAIFVFIGFVAFPYKRR